MIKLTNQSSKITSQTDPNKKNFKTKLKPTTASIVWPNNHRPPQHHLSPPTHPPQTQPVPTIQHHMIDISTQINFFFLKKKTPTHDGRLHWTVTADHHASRPETVVHHLPRSRPNHHPLRSRFFWMEIFLEWRREWVQRVRAKNRVI